MERWTRCVTCRVPLSLKEQPWQDVKRPECDPCRIDREAAGLTDGPPDYDPIQPRLKHQRQPPEVRFA